MLKKLTVPLFISLAIVLFFSVTQLGTYFFNYSFDMLASLNFRGEKSSDVIIVAVDDATLARYDRANTGYIPKEVYAGFINKMASLGPSVLAFDVLFDVRIPGEGDGGFESAVRSYKGKLVFGSYIKKMFGSGADDVKVEPGSELGNPDLSFGYVNIFRGISQDYDGIRRRFRPVEYVGTQIMYSLPLAAADRIFKVAIDSAGGRISFFDRQTGSLRSSIAVSEQGCGYINYAGDSRVFHVIPFHEIMDADETKARIYGRIVEGKAVIVGSLSPRHRDYQDIPSLYLNLFKRKKQEYGVVILANILASIMNGRIMNAFNPAAESAIVVSLCAVSGALFSSVSPLAGFLILAALILTFIFASFMLFVKTYIVFNFFALAATAVLVYLSHVVLNYYRVRNESRFLESILKKYVSPEVAKHITRVEIERLNEGSKKVVTVLFADIRGFTPLSERLDPKEISALLNEYFNKMTEVAFRNRGTVDKFIGDAIMLIFGAPVELEDAAFVAVRTAIEMREELERMKARWKEKGSETIDIGIGINTGEAFVGNIGSDIHKEYTVLGDNVNTAARLEGKALPGQILISESTLKLVGKRIKYNALEPVTLKGKSHPVEVFEVIGFADRPAGS